VVKTIEAPKDGDARQVIQDAINEVSQIKEDSKGFRGTILLKKGVYRIADSIYIHAGGIVLRGEGDSKNGTVLVASGKGQRTLINIVGKKGIKQEGDKIQITDAFVAMTYF
jgi:pectin methylesterase-like acyl-CoA thioesterase